MDALVMMLLATASVGLWTLRIAVTARGARGLAAVVAAVEAVVYVCTFGRLLTDLTAVDRLGGFALGVGIGTYLGLLLDEHAGAIAARCATPDRTGNRPRSPLGRLTSLRVRRSQARGRLDVQVGVGELRGEDAGRGVDDDGTEAAQACHGAASCVESRDRRGLSVCAGGVARDRVGPAVHVGVAHGGDEDDVVTNDEGQRRKERLGDSLLGELREHHQQGPPAEPGERLREGPPVVALRQAGVEVVHRTRHP